MRVSILTICILFATILILNLDLSAQENSYPPYAIISLESTNVYGGSTRGINNLGEATGEALPDGGTLTEPYYWSYSTGMQTLGNFGGIIGTGWEINDIGYVVGEACNIDFNVEAFVWDGQDKIILGSLGGDDTRAYSINNTGYIVGQGEYDPDLNGGIHGFLWYDGIMTDLGVIADCCSSAEDINEAGTIVGWSSTEQGFYYRHAVMWLDGQIIDLGTLEDGKGKSEARAINDLNQVVGYSYYSNFHAFFWDQGIMYDIHTNYDWDESLAKGINNNSEVVGYYSRFNYPNDDFAGFIWDPVNGSHLLNKIIPPNSNWKSLKSAWDINDLGQIACRGVYTGGSYDNHSVIATPVYPSIDLSKVRPGVAGEMNGIRATNVTPGTRVYFTWSVRGGGALIPGCDVTVNALQIDNPKLAGSAVADENGVAQITGKIPVKVKGLEVLFQAVVPGTCEISNLVVQKFE